jgi:hypothetical protein
MENGGDRLKDYPLKSATEWQKTISLSTGRSHCPV